MQSSPQFQTRVIFKSLQVKLASESLLQANQLPKQRRRSNWFPRMTTAQTCNSAEVRPLSNPLIRSQIATLTTQPQLESATTQSDLGLQLMVHLANQNRETSLKPALNSTVTEVLTNFNSKKHRYFIKMEQSLRNRRNRPQKRCLLLPEKLCEQRMNQC